MSAGFYGTDVLCSHPCGPSVSYERAVVVTGIPLNMNYAIIATDTIITLTGVICITFRLHGHFINIYLNS